MLTNNNKIVAHILSLRNIILNTESHIMNENTKDVLLAFKPMDITNNWVQDCLIEILFRYRSKIDPRNRKMLLLYRVLGIKYRVLHTLQSRFKNQLVLEEEILLLLDMFVVEAGFNFFIKGELVFNEFMDDEFI